MFAATGQHVDKHVRMEQDLLMYWSSMIAATKKEPAAAAEKLVAMTSEQQTDMDTNQF